jgi:hypothetical protein
LGPLYLRTFAREIVHGGNLHGNEEEGKKEETLVSCEMFFAQAENFNQPLRRSTS